MSDLMYDGRCPHCQAMITTFTKECPACGDNPWKPFSDLNPLFVQQMKEASSINKDPESD